MDYHRGLPKKDTLRIVSYIYCSFYTSLSKAFWHDVTIVCDIYYGGL